VQGVAFCKKRGCDVSETHTVNVRLQRSKCLCLPSAVEWYNYTSMLFTQGHKKRDVRYSRVVRADISVSRGGRGQ
jgi:hypothetical protein